MYSRLLLLLCVPLFFCGCRTRYSDFFPYYDNGTKKPSIALLPVYDGLDVQEKKTLETLFPGNFPDTLTNSVRNRLKREGKIYIPPKGAIQKMLNSISEKSLASDRELTLYKRIQGTDYVCLMELASIQVMPYKRGAIKPLYLADIREEDARVLAIAVRVKIVDIRGSTAKMVRQELVQSNHMIVKELPKQQLSLVSARLGRDLAQKIEETLCLKK